MPVPAPEQSLHLKQVAKLFNDIIASIRDGALSIEALEPQAIVWLKDARCKLMQDIEKKYYELERSRHDPLSQPNWAVDPSKCLYLYTSSLPTVLEPYSVAIGENLHQLLKDCGFQHTVHGSTSMACLYFRIQFPPQVAAAPRQDRLRTLQVEDEFSAFDSGGHGTRRGGTFAATNFGRLLLRLLADVREDNGGSNSETTMVAEGNGNADGDEGSGKEGATPDADETEIVRSSQVGTQHGILPTLESELFIWIPFVVVILSTLAAILVAVKESDQTLRKCVVNCI
ncbi:hypothetical protein MVEN_01730600 [Mycena venus]|uniref:Uncharacterized protein n=1 Tax=Mycena venus TaxID=2733690 RepID=A0A8H6XK03_9AGAR|nr:hypothetical protein MVEN_01730600 [Mycena venus]